MPHRPAQGAAGAGPDRGKPVEEALAILSFLPQARRARVAKVLKSATANAENNFNLDPDELIV